jgi:hypothetical protein
MQISVTTELSDLRFGILQTMPRVKLNKEDITPEKLRTFKGFENVTDEEAQMICEFTIQYSSIIYEVYQHNTKGKSYDKRTK